MPPDVWVESRAHVYVIRHLTALYELAFLLPGQRVEDCAKLFASLPKDRFSSSFGHEDYVVLAVPF